MNVSQFMFYQPKCIQLAIIQLPIVAQDGRALASCGIMTAVQVILSQIFRFEDISWIGQKLFLQISLEDGANVCLLFWCRSISKVFHIIRERHRDKSLNSRVLVRSEIQRREIQCL